MVRKCYEAGTNAIVLKTRIKPITVQLINLRMFGKLDSADTTNPTGKLFIGFVIIWDDQNFEKKQNLGCAFNG